MIRALAVLGAAVLAVYLVVTGGRIAGFYVFDLPMALLAFGAATLAAIVALRYI
jgi:hypothetical protein